jgi:hypothetical protein
VKNAMSVERIHLLTFCSLAESKLGCLSWQTKEDRDNRVHAVCMLGRSEWRISQ